MTSKNVQVKLKARRCRNYLERRVRIWRSLLNLYRELQSNRGSMWDCREDILMFLQLELSEQILLKLGI